MPDIRLANIVVRADIQPRANSLNQTHVEEMVQRLTEGGTLPPVVVYKTPGGELLLSEGFHRLEAYRRAGRTHVPTELRDGTEDEAKLNAMASNQGHGLKRTNEDKRRAIAEVLKLKPEWSDSAIGKHLGVDHKTVADERGVMERRWEIPTSQKREDSTGRKQPAKKQRPKASTCEIASSPPEPVSQPTPPPVADPENSDTSVEDGDYVEIGDAPAGIDRIELSHADPLFARPDAPKPNPRPSLPGIDDPPTEESLIAKEAVAKYGKFRKWVLSMGRMTTEFSDLMKGPGTHYLRNLMADGEPVLKEVSKDTRTPTGTTRERVWVFPPLLKFIEFVKNALPHKVCDGCRGHGESRDGRTCPACGAVGYLPVVRLPPPKASHLPFAPALDPWETDDLPEQ